MADGGVGRIGNLERRRRKVGCREETALEPSRSRRLLGPTPPGGAATGSCPHCGGRRLSRFGRTPRGAQRWHCRNCGRKHQATTGTAFAGLRQPAKLAALLVDMLGPRPASCRGVARLLAIDKSTAWRWRLRLSRAFAAAAPPPFLGQLERGQDVRRESRKASREWVNHRRDPAAHPVPDRLRWVDYRRLGRVPPDHLPRYRIPVDIAVDGTGHVTARVRHGHRWPGQPSRPAPAPMPAAQAPSLLDGGRLDRWSTHSSDAGLAHAMAAFRDFLRPFCGPATRHLPAYVAWFVARTGATSP